MNLSEFKDSKLILDKLKSLIKSASTGKITIMEVCGTHTMALFRFGVRDVLPPGISLISGPGCPVCVTDNLTIDKLLFLAKRKDVVIATFGDMLRVPGTNTSLYHEKANGAKVEILYSPLLALETAKKYPDKKVVFIAVGFETTIPAVALTLKMAKEQNIRNFYILSAHKTIPKALEALASMEKKVDAFLLPGHVSSIIGASAYDVLAEKYGIPGVVAGFEPVDMLQAIYMIVRMVNASEKRIVNQYSRVVSGQGNIMAQNVINEVFDECDAMWRGIGEIPGTGLKHNKDYEEFDIEKQIEIDVPYSKEPAGCLCGEVLCGTKLPLDCSFFGKKCNHEHPVGPCMVSYEGTCAAYYKYAKRSYDKV
ncbi:MAG: hydrogenase formation protein HypD [Ruminiclostridium sp.]|nr:hydrogenase formation protein HypD [Ruminiclostridium sp.]